MRAVDLFAGAGGWTEGARLAGVEVVAAINHWPAAVEWHARNHPETAHFCQDAALLDPRALPAFDVLLASPECRGHARARGKERPHHDGSRATAWCVVNIVEVTRPALVCVENVPDFATWALYGLWRAALVKLGYKVAERTLRADNFGVPQERERLIVTAVRDSARPVHVEPPRQAPIPFRTVAELDAGDWSHVEKPGRAPATLARIRASRERYGDTFLIPYYGSARVGRSLDRPIGTLTTRARYAIVDGDRMRMLTRRETARAMSFRDDYALPDVSKLWNHLLGNAVPPLLGAAVLRQAVDGLRSAA